ncbi:proteasome assembly chaperone 3-like isoform X1 [Apostichopus japonicus]|uniref:proteasome assembly chaperone 3-like isoform X1 n=2 Tax=Stichopus japonicus TaxID=307972 RepID=UPI003AB85DDF
MIYQWKFVKKTEIQDVSFIMPGQVAKPHSKKGAAVINGNHTDVVCIGYEDKTMLIVSQYQKMGSMVYITKDGAPIDNKRQGFTTNVLLGEDKPVLHVFARNLAEVVYAGKPIVMGIALKDDCPSVMKALQSLLKDYKM